MMIGVMLSRLKTVVHVGFFNSFCGKENNFIKFLMWKLRFFIVEQNENSSRTAY